jgi:tetratricopeptide (TPR) repeat protein
VEYNRYALLIGTDEYKDPELPKLDATVSDVDKLEIILKDPIVGAYDVQKLINKPSHILKKEIQKFFKERKRGDTSLIYFACHGQRGPLDSLLYLATSDTETEYLDATSISAEFVDKRIVESLSDKNIVVLDCCFSGRFTHGWRRGIDEDIKVKDQFTETIESGTVILASSTKYQSSYEVQVLRDKEQEITGIFTHLIIEGLKGLKADRDKNGIIRCSELIEFVKANLKEIRPEQQPEISILKNDIIIAGIKEIYDTQSINNNSTINKAVISYLDIAKKSSFLGEYKHAIGYYEKALEIDPNNFEGWSNKGYCLMLLKKHEDAILCYEKALEIDPNNYYTWHNKGYCLMLIKKSKKAVECFEKALELNSNHLPSLIKIGDIYKNVILQYYKDPFEYTKLHNVSHEGIKIYCDTALGYYERASSLDPNDPDVNLSLGTIWYLKEKFIPQLRSLNLVRVIQSWLLTVLTIIEFYEKSLGYFEKVLEKNESNLVAQYWKANIIFRISIFRKTKTLLTLYFLSLALAVMSYSQTYSFFIGLPITLGLVSGQFHNIFTSRVEDFVFIPRIMSRYLWTIIALLIFVGVTTGTSPGTALLFPIIIFFSVFPLFIILPKEARKIYDKWMMLKNKKNKINRITIALQGNITPREELP